MEKIPTQAALKGLVRKPGRYRLGPGLFFRVLPHAKAYFVYRYALDGKEREMSLGPYPETSLADANARHAEMRAKVKSGKIDPLAEKQAAKEAKAAEAAVRATPTFGQIADDHVATHEASWKNAIHREQWRSTLGAAYCATIRDLPVDEVDTAAVLKVLKPIWSKTPETASRLRGRIETVLDAARALGHIDENRANPARWRGHLDKLLPNPKKIGERGNHAAMPYQDVPAFMERLKATPGVAAKALRFLILTAARSGEVFGATFDEVDLGYTAVDEDGQRLPVPAWLVPGKRMKMGALHRVPLSDAVVEIVEDQLATRRDKQTLLFELPIAQGRKVHRNGGRQPLSAMALTMLLRRLGADQYTVHGFRSSFRDWATEVGKANWATAEKCLAHAVGNKSSQSYDRSDRFLLRQPLMAQWAKYLLKAESDNVVPLRSGKRS